MNQYPMNGMVMPNGYGVPAMPNQYPVQGQMVNGFGMPAVQGQYPGMGGFPPQQQPVMPNPYFGGQPQGYQYPTVAGQGGVYPATNMPQNNGGMQVGGIYMGETPPSNIPSGLQQHLTPGVQTSASQPQGASYPQWFPQYTGIPVNQLEHCIRQTLNGRLTRLMEKVGTTVFAKFVTPSGLDQNFVSNLLANIRRMATVIILVKHKPTMVEAVGAAVEYGIYGTLVNELGGIDSPSLQSYEMITGVNLRQAWSNFSELVLDPQAYTKVVTQHQQQFQQAVSTTQTQQQQLTNAYAPPVQQQPQQGLAAIVVPVSGSMADPLDVIAQEAYDKRLGLIELQQQAAQAHQQMVNKQSNAEDPWNLGLVAEAPAPAVAAPVKVAPMKLYNQYLQVVDLTYHEGVKHHPRFKNLSDGTQIQSLFEPAPLDPMDYDLFYRAEDQYLADMEIHYANKRRAEAQLADVAQKQAAQQAAQSVTQNAVDEAVKAYQETIHHTPVIKPTQPTQQPTVNQPVAPVVQPDTYDRPPVPTVGHVVGQQRRVDNQVIENEESQGGEIQTNRNGGVIPGAASLGHSAWINQAPMYYGAGSAETNLAAPTTIHGELENEADDAFAALVHDSEAAEAAELEAINQAYGNPQSMDEILDGARERGIDIPEPELRVDYLNIEPAARKRICRDVHIRKVPAYLKGNHNLTMVTKGSRREVVLEKVESVDYLKHETEHHHVSQYDTWNPQSTAENHFVEHIKAASANVWSEQTFVNKLNEKLEGITASDERDQELFKLIADRPIVEIEDLLTNTTSSDEYQSEVAAELNDRDVEDIGYITETAIINYKRFNTSRVVLQGDNLELFREITTAKTAGGVIEAILMLKQNTTIPTRDVARLLKVFNNHVNVKLSVIFANGWGVTDAVTDYDDLMDALTHAYANMTVADIQATLTAIYLDAVSVAFHMAIDNSKVDLTAVVGNVESVTLLPYFYRDYALAKADDVGYLDNNSFPELVTLLKAVSGGYSVIKLVTLDNAVMTFTCGGEDEFFITDVNV